MIPISAVEAQIAAVADYEADNLTEALAFTKQSRMFSVRDLSPAAIKGSITTYPQLSKEWFAQRKNRITGSRLSQFLFMRTLQDMKDAWGYSFGGVKKPPIDSLGLVRCRWGQKHEIYAVYSLLLHFKDMFYMDVSFRVHPRHPSWMGCTSDGIITCGHDRERRILEIKCPYGDFEGDGAKAYKAFPQYYIPQIIMQQLCYGIPTTLFVIWTKKAFKVYKVEFDIQYAETLVRFLTEFYMGDKGDLCTHEPYMKMRIAQLREATANFKKLCCTTQNPRGGYAIPKGTYEAIAAHLRSTGHA
jgi:hypothetical protein